MKEPVYLSRITLKRSPEIAPLIDVLQPDSQELAISTDHRLVWSVMPEEVQNAHNSKRQAGENQSLFLWRRDQKKGAYYILGPQPVADSSVFEIETKPFKISLSHGDRLQFVLRTNATVDRRNGGRNGKTQRCDVAMDLLKNIPQEDRAERRQDLAAKAAREWLARRAAADGFQIDALMLDGYRAAIINRAKRKPARIGILDLRGVLTVQETEAFLTRLHTGFGRAKAFGCGLMLIKRAN